MDAQTYGQHATHWLMRLLIVLPLATSWPVQAITEKVPPTTAPVYVNALCEYFFGASNCHAGTASAACGLKWDTMVLGVPE